MSASTAKEERDVILTKIEEMVESTERVFDDDVWINFCNSTKNRDEFPEEKRELGDLINAYGALLMSESCVTEEMRLIRCRIIQLREEACKKNPDNLYINNANVMYKATLGALFVSKMSVNARYTVDTLEKSSDMLTEMLERISQSDLDAKLAASRSEIYRVECELLIAKALFTAIVGMCTGM